MLSLFVALHFLLSEQGNALVCTFSTALAFGGERGIKNRPIIHIMPGFSVQADYY